MTLKTVNQTLLGGRLELAQLSGVGCSGTGLCERIGQGKSLTTAEIPFISSGLSKIAKILLSKKEQVGMFLD